MSSEKTINAYAIIETGSKQYRVSEGDIINVELLGLAPAETIEFEKVLFVYDGKAPHVGAPVVSGFTVKGEIMSEIKGPKVVAFKYRRRKDSSRKVGHRQKYSRVKIVQIAG